MQNLKRKIKRWVDKQHLVTWRGLSSTQRQAQKLISDPSPTTKTDFCPLQDTIQGCYWPSYGYNTLRRNLHLMGLNNSPNVGGVEQRKKPKPTFYECVKTWLHSDIHIWAPLSWTERIFKVQVWGPSGTLPKEQGSLDLVSDYGALRAHLRPRCIQIERAQTQL